MRLLRRTTVWLTFLAVFFGVSAQPLPISTPPALTPTETPAPAVIALPGSEVDNSTNVVIPDWLQLILLLVGGAGGAVWIVRQTLGLLLDWQRQRLKESAAEAEARRTKELEETRADNKRDEQNAALITELIRVVAKSNEQQAQWLPAIQEFTKVIGENNIRSANERSDIQTRQATILTTLDTLVSATNNNSEIIASVVQPVAQEAATLNVLMGVLINLLRERAAQSVSSGTESQVREVLEQANSGVVEAINVMDAEAAKRDAPKKVVNRKSVKD